jgi:hypothetical protein
VQKALEHQMVMIVSAQLVVQPVLPAPISLQTVSVVACSLLALTLLVPSALLLWRVVRLVLIQLHAPVVVMALKAITWPELLAEFVQPLVWMACIVLVHAQLMLIWRVQLVQSAQAAPISLQPVQLTVIELAQVVLV